MAIEHVTFVGDLTFFEFEFTEVALPPQRRQQSAPTALSAAGPSREDNTPTAADLADFEGTGAIWDDDVFMVDVQQAYMDALRNTPACTLP